MTPKRAAGTLLELFDDGHRDKLRGCMHALRHGPVALANARVRVR
jgi:hypothetical protein